MLTDANTTVVIFVSSYHGHPPDNATKFVSWIQDRHRPSLVGMSFAVFGVGNARYWQTYMKVPKDIVGYVLQNDLFVRASCGCRKDSESSS